MVYSQDYINKFKFIVNMFKAILLTTTATFSSIVAEELLSDLVNPILVTLTAVAGLILMVYRALNEKHKYGNRKKQRDEEGK